MFVNMHYMELGGAERALLGLLNALDTSRVEVDLFINQHTGEFMPLIPEKIHLLPEKRGYNAIERPMKQILLEGQLGVLYGRLKAKRLHASYHASLTGDAERMDSSGFQYVADAVQPFLPSLDYLGEYDLAISFITPHNIVLNKVKAKKKIAWIHTDEAMTISCRSRQTVPAHFSRRSLRSRIRLSKSRISCHLILSGLRPICLT